MLHNPYPTASKPEVYVIGRALLRSLSSSYFNVVDTILKHNEDGDRSVAEEGIENVSIRMPPATDSIPGGFR